MLRDRFGPAGLVVFNAFLCACKRNLVPGQIEYGTEPDCLAQIGLPGLELVNESGEPFTLQSLWSALADHKQITTSRRGRLIQVRSSKWQAWQEDAISERRAEQKRRSRREDTGPTEDDYDDDPGGSEAENLPETETDTETDNPPPQVPPMTPNGAVTSVEEEDHPGQEPDPETLVCELVARRRHDKLTTPIPDGFRRKAWIAKTAASVRASSQGNIPRLLAGMSIEAVVDTFEPPVGPVKLVPPYPAAGEQREPVWDFDDAGNAVPRVSA